MNNSFNLIAFETLPLSLKPSDYVDFLLFFVREKHCVRLGFNQMKVYQEMAHWCNTYHLSYVISKEGFMYISKFRILTHLAKIVDNSTNNHSFLFGKILGYPSCCSRKIASIGECNIDEYENKLIKNFSFQHPYHITNPKGYIEGFALISHIPCCATCKKSLRIASKAYHVVEANKEHIAFRRWKYHWFQKYTSNKI